MLSRGARRCALVVLTAIYVVSFLDRQVVNILAESRASPPLAAS